MDIPKDVLEAAGVTLEEALDIVTPDHHGPTWDRNPDGTFKLPERTLGWQVIAWCADYLSNPKGDGPWTFTLEQARFTLWWYAVDCEGKFIYRTGVLQRLKGWGKDPLLAAIVLTEFAGPSLVKRDREDRVVWGEDGNPIGVRHPEAWVQIAAVNQAQTRNTMTMISAIMTDKFKSDFMVKPGAEVTRGYYGRIRLECVTKNYRALEGVRSTFVVMNETHHWLEGNWGHDMYRTIDGNATKMGGRYIAITNAYMPGENSVAQNMREKYELILEGKSKNNRFLYDTLEAKAKAPLTGPLVPYILEAVRGDAVWLPIEEVLDSIADRQIGPARSRRMWLNQIVSGEDSLYTPGIWKSIEDEELVLAPGDTIVLGFDGGKTDDSTALVAIRTADRAAFLLCLEEKPRGPAGENWEVDRDKVDGIVRETFRIYNVQAMYADVAQWESYITDWADAYGEGLLVKASDRNAIAFDMRSKKKESTEAHQRLISSILDGKLKHDGDPRLRRHVLNVYRRPNAWGVYFDKESRESPRKVDAYAALMLAHEAMENLRLRGTKKPVRTGRSWFI